MSFENTAWVIRHSPYKGVPFAVHLCIADLANSAHGDEIKMRQEKIATMARTTRATVAKIFREMQDDGLLELVQDNSRKGYNSPSVFRLICPEGADTIYDRHTKSGRPDDTEPEVERPASHYRKTKATLEQEAMKAAGAPTLFAPDTVEDDLPATAPILIDDDHDIDLHDDRPDAVVLPMNPPGNSRRADPDQPETSAEALEQLSPSPIDPEDDRALTAAAQAVFVYYKMWRTENNLGPVRVKNWPGQIIKMTKAIMAQHGVSPQVAASVVMRWHDECMAKTRRDGTLLQPGAIVSIAQGMLDRTEGAAMHGIDGKGTSAKQSATNARLSALADPSAYANLI